LKINQLLSYLTIPPKVLESEGLLPLRVSENRVLGRIFGQKRDEVTGELEKIV
jgi:hypothetical protein